MYLYTHTYAYPIFIHRVDYFFILPFFSHCKNIPFTFDSDGKCSQVKGSAWSFNELKSVITDSVLSRRRRLISENGFKWQLKVLASKPSSPSVWHQSFQYVPAHYVVGRGELQLDVICGNFNKGERKGRLSGTMLWLTEVCSPQMMAWYTHMGRKVFIGGLRLHLNSWRSCYKW